MVHHEILEPGQTIISEVYQQQLIRLSDAKTLEEKRLFTGWEQVGNIPAR